MAPFQTAKILLAGQVHFCIVVMYGGQEFIQQVGRLNFQASGVDTGMATEIFIGENFTVYQQADVIVRIVHQAHDTHGTRRDVQKFSHPLGRCERQPRAVYLTRYFLCFEDLITPYHQEVEFSLLTVAEE